MSKWDAVQLCIQERAVMARITYNIKPGQDPLAKKKRKWHKLTLTENDAEPLSDDLEAEYRRKCTEDCKTGHWEIL
ncbi:hypothetical protein AX14_009880 [Amanita brunnescens Koide BX004]|nr:hypothetical protein AX14_009880 [Amanita brunnescens Koide BX004]